MQITLKQIYYSLFLIGIFFIPFNSYEGIKILGEFKKESASIFILLAFVFLMIESFFNKKISIPYNNIIFKLLLFFIFICLCSFLFNFYFISGSFFKKTTGISRFIRQFISLLLSTFVFFIVYWNVFRNMTLILILNRIRFVFLCSFIIVSIYGLFEILYLLGFFPAIIFLKAFNYFPFIEHPYFGVRIMSVCFEPPALATYLITVGGWMFSYIITHKGFLKYIPTILILILTYYSGSRTALIVVVIQLLFFLNIILNNKQKLKLLFSSISLIFVLSLGLATFSSDKIINDIEKKIESLDFKSNLKKNPSNQSRFGIQYANLVVFSENPIFGVGYGQQAFHATSHYPLWAKNNNYEFKFFYMNKNNPSFPPGYNLFVRLLAETGIVGFLCFIFFLRTLVKETKKLIKFENITIKTLSIVCYITFIGLILNWFQTDSLRTFGFWICLAILIKINNNIKNLEIEK